MLYMPLPLSVRTKFTPLCTQQNKQHNRSVPSKWEVMNSTLSSLLSTIKCNSRGSSRQWRPEWQTSLKVQQLLPSSSKKVWSLLSTLERLKAPSFHQTRFARLSISTTSFLEQWPVVLLIASIGKAMSLCCAVSLNWGTDSHVVSPWPQWYFVESCASMLAMDFLWALCSRDRTRTEHRFTTLTTMRPVSLVNCSLWALEVHLPMVCSTQTIATIWH